jgi:hypothetical protein
MRPYDQLHKVLVPPIDNIATSVALLAVLRIIH